MFHLFVKIVIFTSAEVLSQSRTPFRSKHKTLFYPSKPPAFKPSNTPGPGDDLEFYLPAKKVKIIFILVSSSTRPPQYSPPQPTKPTKQPVQGLFCLVRVLTG